MFQAHTIRSDLRWDDHVFNVSKEAAKCLGFLKRCKKDFTPSDLRTIYVTYIRPKMEYNSHLWAGVNRKTQNVNTKVSLKCKSSKTITCCRTTEQ